MIGHGITTYHQSTCSPEHLPPAAHICHSPLSLPGKQLGNVAYRSAEMNEILSPADISFTVEKRSGETSGRILGEAIRLPNGLSKLSVVRAVKSFLKLRTPHKVVDLLFSSVHPASRPSLSTPLFQKPEPCALKGIFS
jgi:hypothetical protein